jgi:peptidoglycan/LPS O-acetylase OafA/YrhL
VLWLLVPSITLILATAATGATGYPLDFIASPYHLEFATGILVAWLLRSQPQPQRGPALLLTSAGVSVFLVAAIWTSPSSILETPLIGRFVFGISAAAIILGCTRLETIGAIRIGPRLQVLGAMSYAVYLTHVVTESFSMRLVMKLPASLASPETAAVIISLAGAAGGWAFWRFVERPLLDRLQQRRSGRLQPAAR